MSGRAGEVSAVDRPLEHDDARQDSAGQLPTRCLDRSVEVGRVTPLCRAVLPPRRRRGRPLLLMASTLLLDAVRSLWMIATSSRSRQASSS